MYMPQIHFSVDETTARQLADEAAARGVSLSRYVASLVTREVSSHWPEGYLTRVVGSCADAPLEEPEDLALDDVNV
jgi:hypothetical protein